MLFKWHWRVVALLLAPYIAENVPVLNMHAIFPALHEVTITQSISYFPS
jgi:hypothetical protein